MNRADRRKGEKLCRREGHRWKRRSAIDPNLNREVFVDGSICVRCGAVK